MFGFIMPSKFGFKKYIEVRRLAKEADSLEKKNKKPSKKKYVEDIRKY